MQPPLAQRPAAGPVLAAVSGLPAVLASPFLHGAAHENSNRWPLSEFLCCSMVFLTVLAAFSHRRSSLPSSQRSSSSAALAPAASNLTFFGSLLAAWRSSLRPIVPHLQKPAVYKLAASIPPPADQAGAWHYLGPFCGHFFIGGTQGQCIPSADLASPGSLAASSAGRSHLRPLFPSSWHPSSVSWTASRRCGPHGCCSCNQPAFAAAIITAAATVFSLSFPHQWFTSARFAAARIRTEVSSIWTFAC